MNILAIDTSNPVLGVALVNEDHLIGEVITNIKKGHSERLMPAIDQLLNDVEMNVEDIDKIVVAQGPGSYTGVRIGLTTAKTLAWALDIPIVGVSSIEALAYQGRLSDKLICPFFDARRGTVYTGLYQWDNGIKSIEEDQNVLMADWLEKLAERDEEVVFLSPDMHVYRDMIQDLLGDHAIIPELPYQIARPSELALAGMNKGADHVHALTPNYLRLAEAEVNWLKAQKETS